MPTNFKRMVRERQLKTGESHQTAARHVRGVRPPGGFEALVLRIIELAKVRNQQDAARPTRTIRYLPAPNEKPYPIFSPGEKALRTALSELSWPVLRKVEVLMYSGRERQDVHVIERTLPRDDAPIITVDVIAGKRPVDEYLEEGLALAKKGGVDLDGEF